MSLAPGYRLIDVAPSRVGEVLRVASWAFADELKDEDLPHWEIMTPASRMLGVEIDDASRGTVGTLAGVAATFRFGMRVPGGAEVPVAGLTGVGVHTGHRRRGLLTAMMAAHLEDARRRGEVASALYAAETSIYQRFGYGLASWQATVRVPRGAGLRPVPGSEDLLVAIEPVDPARHGPVISSVQARLTRPGSMTLADPEALAARFADPSVRHQSEPLRMLTVTTPDGDPRAFAMLRRRSAWGDDALPDGVVTTQELAALDAAAAHRLWSVLLDIDLMGTVTADPLALDDPLLHLLEDPRSARARVFDNLWLRLVDLPAALEARTYAADVDTVLEVDDPLVPDNTGRWHLTVDGGDARVAAAPEAAPDVRLGIADLGAAYLGGTSLAALASAGRVIARDAAALELASAAFGAAVAPVCNLHF
ncbi:GNAT family N-acetyltransferase [Demequina sp. SYSU T00039]|uniref:GNAT family N-acetyltransferase n=1 Tax=Demequina lignilytica TaxID=3051663 RepID=A0AAW7M8Y7_9MICO|nr:MULTISPECIES: GNAT family N-acetyltransferase [unclassified Demequina]MDN4479249.1 GNAT family N-acetyltransferase [Demequina sp. SYSU T00039-1]MDN4487567.1 GNAT family N-acetyltransferase [Demequina sp. SYSU T00039]